MNEIKNRLKLIVPFGLAALLTAAPAHGARSSPICEILSEQIFRLAVNHDKTSQLLGTAFQFEYQMELSPEDAECIDDNLKNVSSGKYRFIPIFDSKKGYYFKIEKSPQYLASNQNRKL